VLLRAVKETGTRKKRRGKPTHDMKEPICVSQRGGKRDWRRETLNFHAEGKRGKRTFCGGTNRRRKREMEGEKQCLLLIGQKRGDVDRERASCRKRRNSAGRLYLLASKKKPSAASLNRSVERSLSFAKGKKKKRERSETREMSLLRSRGEAGKKRFSVCSWRNRRKKKGEVRARETGIKIRRNSRTSHSLVRQKKGKSLASS